MNRVVFCGLLLGLVAGCGGGSSDQPPVGQVTGKVTLDGSPLEGATVYFRPEAGGKMSEAVTDSEGNYELTYLRDVKGAIVGSHLVRITTFQDPVVGDDGKVAEPGSPEKVAPEFNKNSTLTVEVVAGTNTHNFDVRGR